MPSAPFASKTLHIPHTGSASSSLLAQLIDTQKELAAAEPDVQTLMQIIADRSRQILAADGAAIELIEGVQLFCHAAAGNALPLLPRQLHISYSFSGKAALAAELHICNDTLLDPRASNDIASLPGVRSIIAAPIAYNANVTGILKVFSVTPYFFDEQTHAGVQLLANLLAAGLHHTAEFQQKKNLLAEHTFALAALRQSEQCFRRAFETTSIGKALVSLNGGWIKVNRSLCQMLGYTEPELLASNFQAITHPEDLDADLALVRQLIGNQIENYQLEKRYIHKLGHFVTALLTVSLVRDDADKPLYFISQIQEITP